MGDLLRLSKPLQRHRARILSPRSLATSPDIRGASTTPGATAIARICLARASASQALVTVSTLPAPARSPTSKGKSLALVGPALLTRWVGPDDLYSASMAAAIAFGWMTSTPRWVGGGKPSLASPHAPGQRRLHRDPICRGEVQPLRPAVQLRGRCRLRRPLPAIAAPARTPDRQRSRTHRPFHLSPSPAFPPPGHSIVVFGLVLGDLLVGQRHVEKLVGHPADVLVYDCLGSPYRVRRLGCQTIG